MREVCPTMVPASDQNRDLDRHQDQHESHDQNLAENPKRSVAPLASCGKSTSALNDLPSELRVAISLFLDASDLCRLACGCKMLNDEIAENTQLWREVARTRHKLPPDAIIETSHENDRVFARARDMDGLTLKQMVSVVQQFPESVPSRLVLSTRRYPRHPSVSAEVLQLSGLEARMKPDVLLGSDRCLDTDHPFPVPSRLSRFHFHCIGNNKFSPLVSPIEYFEVTIGDSPVLLHPNECVAIGLRLKSCRLNRRQPGWLPGSWGFHSDDGFLYHEHCLKWDSLSEFNETGATIGCGFVRLPSSMMMVFFIDKNGEIGSIYTACTEPVYPVIGVDSYQKISVNFGRQRPFVHDYLSLTYEYFIETVTNEYYGSMM